MSDENLVDTQEQAEVVAETKVKKGKGSHNLIAEVAAEVENATKQKAVKALDELSDNIEANYLKMGGYLKVVRDNGWFEGFESFDTFVYEKFGFAKRKAEYLTNIYTNLVQNQIPWEKVQHLGWTKLKDLSPILTLENLDEWIAKAENATVIELQAMLKAKPENGGSEKTTDEVVQLKFKLHKDQAEGVQHALAKAKGELQTEYDSVALENICQGYLIGNSGTAGVSLESVMQSAGWEAVLTTYHGQLAFLAF